VEFDPGTHIENKYAVEDLVGRGGMGYVVRARHLVLNHLVAIKFLNPTIATMPEAVQRFVREARAATRITSEHVARVIDVSSLPDGEPYMVMEFLQGRDLGDVVEADGPMPLEVALDYLLQASIAVAEAHATGIVHRDLKPGNLFLTRRSDGTALVKVLDFGISKVLPTDGDDQGSLLTQTSAVMGSPLYISPEQMRAAKEVTAATDIWALGVILYELISGRHPFEGPTLPALCASVLNDPPALISTYVPDLPAGFEAVLMRCFEKAPQDRWPDVPSLAAALEPFTSAAARQNVERIRGIARSAARPVSSPKVLNQPLPSSEPVAPFAPSPARSPGRPRPSAPLARITDSAFELGGAARGGAARRYVTVLVALSSAIGVLLLLFVITRPANVEPPSSQTAAVSSEPPEPAPAPSPPVSTAPLEAVASAAPEAPAPSAVPPLIDDLPADDVAPPSSAKGRPRPPPPPSLPPPVVRAPAPSATASARGRRYGGRE
jgi:serine/threonine-protein kinase